MIVTSFYIHKWMKLTWIIHLNVKDKKAKTFKKIKYSLHDMMNIASKQDKKFTTYKK